MGTQLLFGTRGAQGFDGYLLRKEFLLMRRPLAVVVLVSAFTSTVVCSRAQNPPLRLELNRTGETIVLEPYAPNILRVTLSLQRYYGVGRPGLRCFGCSRAEPAGM